MAAQLLLPAIKALASGGVKKAVMGAAKGAVKGKAKDFVTGKNRKGKGKGKGGALTKSEGGGEEQVEGGKGGAIVPTTPMVGNYKVETLPDKPDEVGKPSKISYESINNQLDSIIGLTNALKKTSTVKLKNAENRRKAERKASEKAKKRQRESLLERGAGKALGMAGNLYGKATQGFDPLKFFTMIFLGSLFNWVTTHGSKIIGFLKVGLALFNNAGKILKSGFKLLGKTFKAAFKLVGKLVSPLSKLSKSVGGALKSVGKKLGSVFGKVGKSLKNFALGIIKKLKALGKALNPLKSLKSLSGAEKKSLKANKGLSKITNAAGGAASNVGTASRATGTMSNATRALRLKHGDEAARMYQGLVDNGMKPSRAAQYVNKSIASGKLTSAPLQGTLGGGKKGSQLFKGGIGRSTNRLIAKVGGKNALKMTKALKGIIGRIPIIGSLITAIVSILAGDPIDQTMFKVGGAALGGFLGSFIPIPVVGTLFGEIVGEYIGDLTYVALKGGGMDAVGKKLKEDLDGLLSMGANAMKWVGNGFGRLYEGLPKIGFGKLKAPNPVWLVNPFNIIEKLGLFHTAFFTDKPMKEGEVKKNKKVDDGNDTLTPVSAGTQQTLNTALPSDVDTNMSIGSQLKKNFGYKTGQEVKFKYGGSEYVARKTNQGWEFFDQKGLFGNYRPIDTKGKNQQMVAAFIKSVDTIDGSKAPSTVSSSASGDYKQILDLIASVEAPSYDTINGGSIPGLSKMTIAQARLAAMNAGYGSGAMGRYQQMPSFVLSRAKSIGLDPNKDIFSPENQDKLAILLIDGAGYKKWKAGEMTTEKFAYNLAGTWRGLPEGPSNLTYQDEAAGRNKAHTTWANVMRVLGGAQVQPQTSNLQGQGLQGDQSSVQPQTPMVPGNVTPSQSQQPGPQLGGLSGNSGSVSYNGQQQSSLSVAYSPFAQSDITSQGMQIISGKGYRASTNSVHKGFDVPSLKGTPVYAYLPGKITQNRPAAGYGNIVEWQDSIYGEKHMFAHLMEPGPLPVGTEFQAGTLLAKTGDTGTPGSYHLHWEIGSQGSEKDPAAWVASHPIKDVPQAQVQQGQQPQQSGSVTPSTGSVTTGPQTSPSTTPAQVSPSPQAQKQRSNEITDVSQQLPYEQSGNTVVMMQGSGGQQMPMGGGGGKGTPVIMGSGDVVNSYYKSQLMGFLYKRG